MQNDFITEFATKYGVTVEDMCKLIQTIKEDIYNQYGIVHGAVAKKILDKLEYQSMSEEEINKDEETFKTINKFMKENGYFMGDI